MNYRQSNMFSVKVKEGMLRAKARGRPSGGFVDLKNRIFGRLVVQEQATNGECGRVRWHCICECGTRTIAFADNLGAGRTKSCGCDQGVRRGKRVPAYKYVWFNYKGSAKRRNLSFDLTLERFAQLIAQRCDYCGREPSQAMSPSQMRHPSYETFRYNGLDRIDSTKGYVESNVVPCCKTCNELKSNKSREEFLAAVEAIHEFQSKPKPRRLTEAEVQRIGEYGYAKMLKDTHSEELAKEFKATMIAIAVGA